MEKMKKKLRKACIITAVAGLLQFGQFGCTSEGPRNELTYRNVELHEVLKDAKKYENQPISLKGIPYSIKYHDCNLVIFLSKDDKGLICVSKSYDRRTGTSDEIAKLEALVEATINNKEEIIIKGVYKSDKNEFRFNEVEAKGYTINLGR